uniref:Uncharacterized protein n=1 Tax=Glossina morsitans morsitans TaxID=37546 RepID=A0A1A9YUI5_GLOMM
MCIEELLRIKITLFLWNCVSWKHATKATIRYRSRAQELLREQTELERLKIFVEQAQVAQRETVQRNTSELALPRTLFPNSLPRKMASASTQTAISCETHNCFDHPVCCLTSGFPVNLYDLDVYNLLKTCYDIINI